MLQLLLEIFTALLRSWRDDNKSVRGWIVVAGILAVVAIFFVVLGDSGKTNRFLANQIAGALGLAAGGISLSIYGRQKSIERVHDEEKIEAVERRYEENPNQPQAAWDLARTKLEAYLNRNLNQVQSIFWLTVSVMIIGFVLIGLGVWKVYSDAAALKPAVVSACAGILVNAIAATFMLVYRSTMEQAKGYVTMLERINAVGMAVQILATIEDEDKSIRPQATADIAKQLLTLYGGLGGRANGSTKARRPTAANFPPEPQKNPGARGRRRAASGGSNCTRAS